MNFRKIIFILILFSFALNVFAQRSGKVKYKEVFDAVLNKSKDVSYPLLLVHQRQDPFHVNTYFQLGLIAQFWAKDYDPLTDIMNVEFFIYNTKLYYGLAKSKLDEKEVRRNRKFYQNVQITKDSTKVQFEDVSKYIDDQIKDIEEYERNVKIITKNYNSAVEHYNECIRVFMEINKSESKIKDIYMAANDEIINKLKKLSASYDSTIFYFQEYKTAIKNYPIKKYNQNLKILSIETYRLEGLTSSDFLQSEVPVWDFGTWVKTVTNVLTKDIKELRAQIVQADRDINERIDFISKNKDYNQTTGFKIDDKIVYKIGKYDQKSLMVDFFLYKEAKTNFLTKTRNPLNDQKNLNPEFTLQKRSRYYLETLNDKFRADSMNKVFEATIDKKSVQKYGDFFQTNYGGAEGLRSYISNESRYLNVQLDSLYAHLRFFLLNNVLRPNDSTSLPYKTDKISLIPKTTDFSDASTAKYFTLATSKDKAGNTYISGFYRQGKINQAFVAKTLKDEKIEWVKTFPPTGQAQECITHIASSDLGCIAVVTSFVDNISSNYLLKLDETGKQIVKKELPVKDIPRYLMYDDLNETVIVATKGNVMNQFDDPFGNLNIAKVSLNDETQNWTKEIPFEGYLTDIVKMDKNYFVFGNFTKLFMPDGVAIISKAGAEKTKTNSFAAIVSDAGQLVKIQPFLSDKPFFSLRAVKINSNVINLLGLKSDAFDVKKANYQQIGKLNYLLINLNAEQYFTN